MKNKVFLQKTASNQMCKVVGVAIGSDRGTGKTPVPFIELKAGYGVLNDGHAGTKKQVSLAATEDIEVMNKNFGINATTGSFAENITTQGLDLASLSIDQKIQIGPAVLKVVCIGKSPEEMRDHKFSFKGFTLLPEKGIFCEVIKGGIVQAGCDISLVF